MIDFLNMDPTRRFEFATKDDICDNLVPSDIRGLLGEIKQANETIAADQSVIQYQGRQIATLRDDLVTIRVLVNKQAEDEGLWFDAQSAPEGYLQLKLRLLHDIIEALTDRTISGELKALATKETKCDT